ncbi:MAG: NUDIX hydrolase [Candidatus Colwellbacteria bacterium]|nr:NUDIX hydrolase [Candidatus Colwellbacteria bacterium]
MADEIKENPKFVNLGVILNNKGEVLLVRRATEETGVDGSVLRWALPGGRQGFGETRSESVKRKILERTGYEVEPITEISLRLHPQFPVVVAYHICHLISPQSMTTKATEADKLAEVKWVKKEEVSKLITTELDPNVKKYLGL